MKNKGNILLMIALFYQVISLAQQGKIEGRVYNTITNEPLPFSNIVVTGTTVGSTSDYEGNFVITGVEPGFATLTVSSLGYETVVTEQIQVLNNKTISIDVPLKESSLELGEVSIKASRFKRKEESPVSLRSLSISEIETSPGANRDISRVIQTLPGITILPTPQRNDVIVRGGASSESRFYLDGIEIPYINHFATQGSSGGPNGILNADFIREVEFYSGAFPANRGNALSGVFNFAQINGNNEKFKYRATLGASEVSFTADGPLSENTTLIASVRRSYLQFLFKAIGLPFLPTFNDFQFKSRTRIDDKNEITLIGLGALDQFALDLGIKNPDEYQKYILDYLPVNEQWNYAFGAVYKHYTDHGYHTVVVSRNHLNNGTYKYDNNDDSDEANLILNFDSQEIENKFRYENTALNKGKYKFNYGVNLEQAIYTNDYFQRIYSLSGPATLTYDSELSFYKFGTFAQVSRSFISNKLDLSLGIRTDFNTYSKKMMNPLDQISSRFSASYKLSDRFNVNFNTGRYYQLPPYTTLGYRNTDNVLVNKENDISYITADHIIGGVEYLPGSDIRISLEGFYKLYNNYPFSVTDSISLANRPADFGTFGDEEVVSVSEGRAYGTELLVQGYLKTNTSVVISYTFVRSEFKDKEGMYAASSWDSKNIIISTISQKFKAGWQAGIKWRYSGGLPYTPYDLEKSAIRSAWDVTKQPYVDYTQLNAYRYSPFHQLDIRIDKVFYFENASLKLYVDVQNLYNFKSEDQGIITNLDEDGNPMIDPDDPSKYVLRTIDTGGSGTILPTIGLILDF
jgi:hypothetical protein